MFEKEFNFKGKHALYVQRLSNKNTRDNRDEEDKSKVKLYSRYIDVYLSAALIGLLYNRRSKEVDDHINDAEIPVSAFVTERENCLFIYRLVILLDKSSKNSNLSDQERLDRVFKFDKIPEKRGELQENLDLFHEYVRGGVEVLYERLIEPTIDDNDYVDTVREFLVDFKISFLTDPNEALKGVLPADISNEDLERYLKLKK